MSSPLRKLRARHPLPQFLEEEYIITKNDKADKVVKSVLLQWTDKRSSYLGLHDMITQAFCRKPATPWRTKDEWAFHERVDCFLRVYRNVYFTWLEDHDIQPDEDVWHFTEIRKCDVEITKIIEDANVSKIQIKEIFKRMDDLYYSNPKLYVGVNTYDCQVAVVEYIKLRFSTRGAFRNIISQKLVKSDIYPENRYGMESRRGDDAVHHIVCLAKIGYLSNDAIYELILQLNRNMEFYNISDSKVRECIFKSINDYRKEHNQNMWPDLTQDGFVDYDLNWFAVSLKDG
jgi:hypothetical protein